jgi:hypothetical protein
VLRIVCLQELIRGQECEVEAQVPPSTPRISPSTLLLQTQNSCPSSHQREVSRGPLLASGELSVTYKPGVARGPQGCNARPGALLPKQLHLQSSVATLSLQSTEPQSPHRRLGTLRD